MSFIIAAVTTAAAVYWYMNRHKRIKHILSELRYALDMQGVGLAGLIDDWLQNWRNKIDLPDTKKKVAIVTGGARGIGTEVVRQLLKANMTVIIGVRRPELVKTLTNNMEHSENLSARRLDLQSMESVKKFADEVLKQFSEIHLLINNAGVMFGEYHLTVDGFETQLATNHLGHFYLTHLLLPALKSGGYPGCYSRVVNVTSCAHYPGEIYFDDINMKEYYDTTAAYAQSKLAQLMSARYINKLMEEEGAPVRCYSVHPGIVNTDLFEKTMFRKHFAWAMKILFKTPEQGAVPILYTCFSEDLEKKGGLYVSNCREGYSNRFSKNVEYQRRLHLLSCEMVGIPQEKFSKCA